MTRQRNLVETWLSAVPLAAIRRGLGSACCATLVLTTCASCVSLPGMTKREAADDRALQSVLDAEQPAQVAAEPEGIIRLHKPAARPASGIERVGYETEARAAGLESVSGPDPRWPSADCPEPGPECPDCFPRAPGFTAMDVAIREMPKHSPDEYLCDGGDRDYPVHYDSTSRLGLDTEDTVAEYVEHTGKNRVKAATRACIYAPRFAAVRTISLPHEEQMITDVAGLRNATGGSGLHSKLGITEKTKRDSVGNVRVRSRAGGLESEMVPDAVETLAAPAIHDKLLNTFQDLAFVRSGTFEQTDAARLQLGLNSALVWSREQNPIIVAKIDVPTEGLQTVTSSCLTVIDDLPSHQPGKLRVVKLADKKAAEPGDVITFTIRYDNEGPREVHHVRIVDNLTPRLEFIPDSATSDHPGELLTEDNGEGSVVLVWELDETLPAKKGGVVTFQCRVR